MTFQKIVGQPKISILVPVFNGYKYLRETLLSIKGQDFDDFEVICVDDCSTDDSIDILREFSIRDPRFLVYQTLENLGIVPKVLNYVRGYIRGAYFVYSSQDDLFSRDWLSSMYKRAVDTNADATIPNLTFYYADNSIKNKTLSGVLGDKRMILDGRSAFLLSLDWTIPGNALWKTWLIRKHKYFDFGMNADEFTARYYFLRCNKVVFSDGEFFYRQNNPDAITKKFSLKTFDNPYTDFMLWLVARDHAFDLCTQERLIRRSIRGALALYPKTFKKEYTLARLKIKSLYSDYKRRNVHGWLLEHSSATRFIDRLSTSSFFGFSVVSFIFLLYNKVRLFWR